MLFDTIAPAQSKFLYQPPKYVEPRSWFEKMYLQTIGGLKKSHNESTGKDYFTGERSAFGKAYGWVSPLQSLGFGGISNSIAKKQEATDSADRIKDNIERDFGKLETLGGLGLAAAGVATGFNPGLISAGIKLGTAGIGQFVGQNPRETVDEQTGSDRGTQYFFKKGGEMKEDIAMIDKKTGNKVGEISYGERVFGKKDNAFMEKLSRSKNYVALGKHVAKTIEKHDENESKDEKNPKKEEKKQMRQERRADSNGVPFPNLRFKLGNAIDSIIHPEKKSGGPSYGHIPSTYKNMLKNNNSLWNKYWDGGKIRKYAGGLIPGVDSQEYQDWLVQNGSLLKSSSSDDLYNLFTQEWSQTEDSVIPSISLRTEAANGDAPSTSLKAGLSGADIGNIASAGATALFDIGKFITGLHGANKSLPSWRMPEDWTNYLGRVRGMADEGFTAPERANALNEINANYGRDITNIENYSGGSNAFALGNQGAAINRRNAAIGDFVSRDAALHRSNLSMFGDAALKTIPFDRQIFEDKFDLDFLNKKTAGELGQQGLQGLFDTAQDFQYTAPGSLYDQMQKQQIEYMKKMNSIDFSKVDWGSDNTLLDLKLKSPDYTKKRYDFLLKFYEDNQ